MYLPNHFQSEDLDQIRSFLQQHYFGLLLSNSPDLYYSPLPFLMDWQEDHLTVFCHLARNNPQLKQLNEQQVQIVIMGPHAFVAADCYGDKQAVSTWNYSLVELKGTAFTLDTKQTLALVRRQESFSAPGMLQSADYQQKLVNGICGVRIEISSILGKMKLSQNKSAEQRQKVGAYLEATEQPQSVWQLMQQLALYQKN
ncbi:MAG: FMN-binding negative transcriptional regulator [Gammaproteobacteria bacterium]|nr:FMN-binding negative transcriptional regulator [Gammaproteobacteria bacterium]MBU2058816.1 FMN-binding negative transcriptional regulator [Gammaproteobacteria bacterium]MBU2177121.1 FMN-binding negative transcriptional regulator [Gammaproteobacteria bacterium]MBU2247107.1 FMN-binding negative transcriptional regulator [Gammaproteobacteria bacterium]MBU2343599.1 FMN-binding negative transcriptional regulator [Gammaproteobacteria bacterium]